MVVDKVLEDTSPHQMHHEEVNQIEAYRRRREGTKIKKDEEANNQTTESEVFTHITMFS